MLEATAGCGKLSKNAVRGVTMAQLKSVYPISGEDTNALPVKEIGPAVAFYEMLLGFSVVSRDASAAALTRDNVRIGLVRKADHKPEHAGSLAFAVDDLDAMHHELQESGAQPGKFGIDQWGGKQYRTFFVREDEDGYCYCFHHPA
jgi:lactoylglutathione lyase